MLGTRRVGHGGTLDPQATGLLPVLVGSATKFADRIHEATKVYDALVRFGSETATDDREGAVTRESGAPALVMAAIEPALATLPLAPPRTSPVSGGSPLARSRLVTRSRLNSFARAAVKSRRFFGQRTRNC